MFNRGDYVQTPKGEARVLDAMRIPDRDSTGKPIVRIVYRVMLTDSTDRTEVDYSADEVTRAN